MADQVVPVIGLDTIGMVKDTPSLAIPPNAFSDALNVRFKDGQVSKAHGEVNVLPTLIGDPIVGSIIYVAYWSNPNLNPTDCYYLLVTTDNTIDYLYVVRASDGVVHDLNKPVTAGGNWQHTVFQGGFAIVINNANAKPQYIRDEEGNLDITNLEMFELSGWDSYFIDEEVVNDTYNSSTQTNVFNLGRKVNLAYEKVTVVKYSAADGTEEYSEEHTAYGTVTNTTLGEFVVTGTDVVTIDTGGSFPLVDGDRVYIKISSVPEVQVRAQVIRAWNDVLVAGGLTQIAAPKPTSVDQPTGVITTGAQHGLQIGDKIRISLPVFARGIYTVTNVPTATTFEVNNGVLPVGTYGTTRYTVQEGGDVVQHLPGLIRVSDQAPPGGIPTNWNPYAAGVSTAEEFQLSSSGVITDIVPMQNNLYIYTNNSIHSLTKTGNLSIPYLADDVTSQIGTLGINCVKEWRGNQIVVGSNDIYLFNGHPSNIKSIASGRVRKYFYDNVSPMYASNTFILINQANDEVWFCFPTVNSVAGEIDEVLVWNYENNTWTRRVITDVFSGDIGVSRDYDDATGLLLGVDNTLLRPLLAAGTTVIGSDFNNKFTDYLGNNYESYVEKLETPMSPEFDTEYLNSVCLWVTRRDTSTNFDLKFRFRPTDYPSQNITATPLTSDTTDTGKNVTFTVGLDYKVDARLNGRFISYRLTDSGATSNQWGLSGMQFKLGKGGTR